MDAGLFACDECESATDVAADKIVAMRTLLLRCWVSAALLCSACGEDATGSSAGGAGAAMGGGAGQGTSASGGSAGTSSSGGAAGTSSSGGAAGTGAGGGTAGSGAAAGGDGGVAPETSIISGPSSPTIDSHAAFELAADRPATFECDVDGAGWRDCASTAFFTDFAPGSHMVEVRARDAQSGVVDPTPAGHTWVVSSIFADPHLGLTPGSPTPQPDPDGGSFRIKCEVSHYAYDDPIVFPDEPGRAHLHMFLGNVDVVASSTGESLLSSGETTCAGNPLNRSSYWIPSLLRPLYEAGGARMLDSDGNPAYSIVEPLSGPEATDVYYKSGTDDLGAIQPMPLGLRMIAGDGGAAAPQTNQIVRWSCESTVIASADDFLPHVPACAPGDLVRLTITFPNCWNGVDLDMPDHKSHMDYPTWDPARGIHCGASHPVTLTAVSYNFAWRVTAGNVGPSGDSSDWRLASDKYTESSTTPGGLSAHGDWFMAWHPEVMQAWIDECIRAGRHCAGGDLGNGWNMNGHQPGPPRPLPAVKNRGLGPG